MDVSKDRCIDSVIMKHVPDRGRNRNCLELLKTKKVFAENLLIIAT